MDDASRAVFNALAARAICGRPPIVLLDGRSGSGKSTLARRLVAEWSDERSEQVSLIRLDDLYPGWDGLEAGSLHVLEHALTPLAAGTPARWQRWDWIADSPAEWTEVDAASALLIEGSGSLSFRNRALATLGIWVELDAEERKRRALARDGDLYAAHWDRWAAQEKAFAEREHPRQAADLIIDGRCMT